MRARRERKGERKEKREKGRREGVYLISSYLERWGVVVFIVIIICDARVTTKEEQRMMMYLTRKEMKIMRSGRMEYDGGGGE